MGVARGSVVAVLAATVRAAATLAAPIVPVASVAGILQPMVMGSGE
jgi:hypothetical protein